MKDRTGKDLKIGDAVLIAGVVQRESGGKIIVELDEPDAEKKRVTLEVNPALVDARVDALEQSQESQAERERRDKQQARNQDQRSRTETPRESHLGHKRDGA